MGTPTDPCRGFQIFKYSDNAAPHHLHYVTVLCWVIDVPFIFYRHLHA
jgi:hypothetical protein